MIDKIKTGENIKRLCYEKGLNLSKLSQMFRSKSVVHKWTTGSVLPSTESLFKLADIYDCSVYDIIVFGDNDSE